jgi:hypothetical protein
MSFSNEAYKMNDPSINSDVMEKTKEHLELQGFTNVVQRAEDYGADWTATLGNQTVLIESQVMRTWKSDDFPYDDIAIFNRYAQKPHTQLEALEKVPVWHIIISDDYYKAMILSWQMIRGFGKLRTITTDRGEENVIMVDKSSAIFSDLDIIMVDGIEWNIHDYYDHCDRNSYCYCHMKSEWDCEDFDYTYYKHQCGDVE